MKKTLLALALLAGFAGTANASELSYNFVEVNYVDAGDFDSNGVFSFTGWNIAGSVALGDNFYLLGDYAQTSDDPFGPSVDIDTYNVGFGYRHNISEKADFYSDLSYSNADVSCFGCGSADGDGYRVRLGFRGALAEKFEGSIGITHQDYNDFGTDTSLSLGGQFKLNDTWGFVANVEAGDNTRYSIGVRASF